MAGFKIIWTDQAKAALKHIYDYYKKEVCPRSTKNIKSDLLKIPKTILFAKQYQLDNINLKYHRIIVRDYKVLYKEENGLIQIVDIISSRQSPEELKNRNFKE